ncbi:MAG: hypothetical protein NW226_18055 [Microscillaceae bacterium]|nr:hypothetical protein [Microscillaceae bacterium]
MNNDKKNKCYHIDPKDGSSRFNRFLKALDPEQPLIDEREIEDLMVFAGEYAEKIRFYQSNNLHDHKSWAKFFKESVAFVVAEMATIDLKQYEKKYQQVVQILLDTLQKNQEVLENKNASIEEYRENVSLIEPQFKALFDIILEMTVLVNRWYLHTAPDFVLKEDLSLLIRSALKPQLKQLIAFSKGWVDVKRRRILYLGLEKDGKNEIDPLYLPVLQNPIWWDYDVEGEDPSNPIQHIDMEDFIYERNEDDQTLFSLYDRIQNASLHIGDIFNSFYKAINDLLLKADYYLQEALNNYPNHPPHLALYLTFLQLTNLAREQMNGLTKAHLDFFYKDILKLQEKSARPDQVYLIFELAKEVREHLLPKDTALTAGKDATKVEQIYQTQRDIVINQAKVKALKTVYIDKEKDEASTLHLKKIYANPKANSADGLGKAFITPDKKWHTFGKKPKKDAENTEEANCPQEPFNEDCSQGSLSKKCEKAQFKEDIPNNLAQIGFAIASPELVCGGGNRKLVFCMPNKAGITANNANHVAQNLTVYLTGEKGWVEVKFINDDVFTPTNGVFATDFKTKLFLSASTATPTALQLHICLPIAEQAIVPFDAKKHIDTEKHTSAFPTPFPVMKVVLDYANFAEADIVDFNIPLENISIQVQVGSLYKCECTDKIKCSCPQDGLRKLILQNGYGVQNPNNPFDPFTAIPSINQACYIGAEEFANKKICKFLIKEFPNSIKINDNETFTASYKVEILNKKSFVEGGTAFNVNQVNDSASKSPNRTPLNYFTQWTNEVDKGFIKVVLNKTIDSTKILEEAAALKIQALTLHYQSFLPALDPNIDQFFHIYPFGVVEVYHCKHIELKKKKIEEIKLDFSEITFESVKNNGQPSKIDSDKIKSKITKIIESPFKDKLVCIGKILIDYVNAIEDTTLAQAASKLDDVKEKICQGISAILGTLIKEANDCQADFQTLKKAKNCLLVKSDRLFPQFLFGLDKNGIRPIEPVSNKDKPNQYNQIITQTGNLYIGIENLHPPQNLSLLFQFAEGSQENDLPSPQIHWSYLTHNEWRPMPPNNILSDTTEGFQQTGIVLLDMPKDATTRNTLMPEGLHWLAVSVDSEAEVNATPMLIDVIAQAVQAGFRDQGNDPARYLDPLPADSISKLAIKVAQVKKVGQPFASFDDKPAQNGKEFYTFASERLRHKGRAITAWDYEHLVLERFPEIYKVKAIPHTSTECTCRHNTDSVVCCSPQIAPGHVLVIPVANMRNRNAVNILEPKVGRRLLNSIQAFLSKRTSPFVRVHVANPKYEQVLTQFTVQFYAGVDKGYHLRKLNEELIRYLTPWAYDDSQEVIFNGKVYASDVINFIEERPYVDFITDFEMYHCKEACCGKDEDNKPALTDSKDIITEIKGQVKDTKGNPLTDFEVYVDRELAINIQIDTSDSSKFTLTNIPTNANLTFKKYGYVREVVKDVTGSVGDVLLKSYSEIQDQETLIAEIEQNLIAQTVIEAENPGAILVSAVRHCITLYPEKPNKC